MPNKRLNLEKINETLLEVEKRWPEIDSQLEKAKLGKRDTAFTSTVRERMVSAYSYINHLLDQKIEPFSLKSLTNILELNNRVHYGVDLDLRYEYRGSIQSTSMKYYSKIGALESWYEKHKKESPMKLAAEMYVGVVGYPQLFIEGNHRTGALIASWINVYHGNAPFVLKPENALAFFAPSHKIKHFTDKTTWRGRLKLPKYKKSFKEFLEDNLDNKYLIKAN